MELFKISFNSLFDFILLAIGFPFKLTFSNFSHEFKKYKLSSSSILLLLKFNILISEHISKSIKSLIILLEAFNSSNFLKQTIPLKSNNLHLDTFNFNKFSNEIPISKILETSLPSKFNSIKFVK